MSSPAKPAETGADTPEPAEAEDLLSKQRFPPVDPTIYHLQRKFTLTLQDLGGAPTREYLVTAEARSASGLFEAMFGESKSPVKRILPAGFTGKDGEPAPAPFFAFPEAVVQCEPGDVLSIEAGWPPEDEPEDPEEPEEEDDGDAWKKRRRRPLG